MHRIVLAALCVLAAATASSADDLELHFVNVGQGDSTLIKCPNGETILIDCGSTGGFSHWNVRKYIRDQLDGTNIDLLVITHPDRDHYNKVQTLLRKDGWQNEITVGRVLFVGEIDDYDYHDDPAGFDEWLDAFPADQRENMGDSDYNVFPSRTIDVCGDVEVNVLAAGVEETDSALTESNALSIVLLIRHGIFDAILPRDATRTTQKDILKRFAGNWDSLDVDVLKVSHHGSKYTSMLSGSHPSKNWFKATKPQVAVFSASMTNTYGHPHVKIARVMKRYTRGAEFHRLQLFEAASQKSPYSTIYGYRREAMFLTATNGNIMVRSDGESYDWELNN